MEDAAAEMAPVAAKRNTAPFKPSEDLLTEPQSTLYLINARAAYFKGDYNTALDQILQSIQAKPDNPQAYAMMGSLYYAMNWKSLALKYWEKSLALDMGNRELESLVTQLRLEKN
jgi:tetratricopeptide (TPR) repeat protein